MVNIDVEFDEALKFLHERVRQLGTIVENVRRYDRGGGKITYLKQFSEAMSSAANTGIKDFKRYRLSLAGDDDGK